MKDKEIAKLVEALSEDFTLRELLDVPKIFEDLRYFLGLSRQEAIALISAAIEKKILSHGKKPYWRLLLNVH